jgi:hypothetical protein
MYLLQEKNCTTRYYSRVLPILLVTYKNFDAVTQRFEEFKELGFNNVAVFVDGFDFTASRKSIENRLALEAFLIERHSIGEIKHLHFNTLNTGVGVAVPTAIDWFFQEYDYGLILEDDCVLKTSAKEVLRLSQNLLFSYDNSIVCLSNPNPPSQANLEKGVLEFSESSFFSSWGWICHRDTWNQAHVREISCHDVTKAVWRQTHLSGSLRILLLISWLDIWHSLKKNQSRLWAFRFSVVVMLERVTIHYPKIKCIQHSPTELGTNVQVRPRWDRNSLESGADKYNFETFTTSKDLNLDQYIARRVQGAATLGLLIRIAFRTARMVRIK